MTQTSSISQVKALLNPASIAIVGASDRNGSWAKRVFRVLKRGGYKGTIYPVNPRVETVWDGLTCYPDLASLPGKPDHVVVLVPGAAAIDAIRAAGKAGARSATVFSSGFGEGGDPEGRALGDQLRAAVLESGLAVSGPNCMGNLASPFGFCTIPDDRITDFTPGAIGYFPEGTRYGPQTSSGNTWNLLLQYGGASGSGYTAESEEERAAGDLKKKGTFEKGVFTYHKEDGTKVNQDAYEAVWEHIHGRPLVYPKERYERPVFMNSANFNWVPVKDQPGVANKLMGVFSERETKLAFYKLDAGAKLAMEDDSFYFVLSGTGEAAGEAVAKHTTVHLKRGESGVLAAKTALECVQLRMPRR